MADKNNNHRNEGGRLGRKSTVAVSAGILLLAAGVVAIIQLTEPQAVREAAAKETAMLVEVINAEYGTFHPEIVVMGTVVPERDVMLHPRVEGEIIERTPAFTPGGFVKRGDRLLRIDPADYEYALRTRESELRRATAALEMERGRQKVARKDYELLAETLSEENEALVLRRPQLNSARADVEAARAAVDQAALHLERTTITAPFDAYILSRPVDVGSQVAPGTDLGRLVGTDTYWVEATVPLSKLSQLDFPEDPGTKGSIVRLHNRSAWEPGLTRTGRLFKLVGSLEERTRMARVLVAVDDPLAHAPAAAGQPPLLIGSFLETRIRGRAIPGVVRLNRDYLRKDDTVWVMSDDQLDIRDVRIAFSDAQFVYIRNGLEGDEHIVTTHLSTVVEGAPLRIAGDGNE